MKTNFVGNGIKILLLGLIWSSTFTACKKTKNNPPDKPADTSGNNNNKPIALSDEDSLKYYIYRYMEVSITDPPDTVYKIPQYFWYAQVPSLDPLSSQYPKAEDLLDKIIGYPKNPSDRYSFLDRDSQVSGEIQGGQSGDMGFNVTYAQDNHGNILPVVLYAYKNSSAGMQGVQRGWTITKVNGVAVPYDEPGYGNGSGNNVQRVIDGLYNSRNTQFTFKKPDSTFVDLTITTSNYAITPVLFDTVYTMGSTKVGYFVFNSFVSVYDDNGAGTETKTELDNVFSKFAGAGVKDVIIDLRYDGGGAGGTTEYIDNNLAPASTSGKVMYQFVYNDKLTQYKTDLGLPDKVLFSPTGTLQLDNVFFITTHQTVSASELTINNLKPFMSVKIVGDTTYGKPFGFFTWSIYDHDAQGKEQHLADLYDVNFQTKNANGDGSYYNGIPEDAAAADYVGYNWGDLNDDNLDKIKKYITTGSFRTSATARIAHQKNALRAIPNSIHSNKFTGLVDFKISRMLQQKMRQRNLRPSH